MKKIISVIALFFLFNSCTPDSGPNYTFEVLPVDSVDIPTEFTLGETYLITMHYKRPSTCHYFNGIYYDKNLNVRTVAVESAVEQRDNCQELTNEMNTCSFNFTVTSNGSYIFKFYNGEDVDGNNTFLEYEVPVN